MDSSTKRLRNAIIIGVIILGVLGIIITIVSLLNNKSEYGESIKIQNYSSKVKNLSKDYENRMASSLYKIVQHNLDSDINGSDVKDAYIREGSDVQNEAQRGVRYQGSFIVDIESLQQSYSVQYAYSSRENDTFVAGYPILFSCVNPQDVKYESFKCKEILEATTQNADSATQDSLINFLPYRTMSYDISADATGETLVIYVNLQIPAVDLKGDVSSRQQMVQIYKDMVTDWIKSKGFDPSKYTIDYNYTNDGEVIVREHDSHGDADEELIP